MKNTLIALVGVSVSLSSIEAAAIYSEWSGGTSGTFQWNSASNWTSQTWAASGWGTAQTPGSVPGIGADQFAVQITNGSAGDLVIETPTDAPLTIGRFWIDQTGAGSTTLKLGSDLLVNETLTGPPANDKLTGLVNSTPNHPGGLVIDLNGNTFSVTSAVTHFALRDARNFTLRDTSAGGDGVFSIRQIYRSSTQPAGSVLVENNVTVKLLTNAHMDLRATSGATTGGWDFSPGATLWLSANNAAGTAFVYAGGNFGNIVVGDANNDNRTRFSLGTAARIAGDLTYHVAKDGNGSSLNMGANFSIYVGGNMSDLATTGENYGTRTLFFNGGQLNEKEVTIARQGLQNSFSFGEDDDAVTAANVALGHDLTTSGDVIVRRYSRLDVRNHTVTARDVQILHQGTLAEPTLGFGFDENGAGLIVATRDLTLNQFSLELTFDEAWMESWTSGDNLLLFQYDNLIGAPELMNVYAPGDFQFTSLAWGEIDGRNYVYMTNVSIPEPGTYVLSAIMLVAMGLGVRAKAGKTTSKGSTEV